jgi:hypothetical protein
MRLEHRRRAGLTLLEVLVSATIVSMLALVLMAANLPISKASSEVGVVFDLDRSAGRFLTELRRELRQSGYNNDTPLFWSSLSNDDDVNGIAFTSVPFRRRIAFGTSISEDWSLETTYARADSRLGDYADGVDRFVIRRTEGTAPPVEVLDHVRTITFTPQRQDGGAMAHVAVALTLRRENPGWSGTGDGRFLERTYSEDIELLNKKPYIP